MNYTSTITSKGTITIAAPLRKKLGLQSGQTVSLRLNANNEVVVKSVVNSLEDFEAIRAKIVDKIPAHQKGLTGQQLKQAAAKAWAAND